MISAYRGDITMRLEEQPQEKTRDHLNVTKRGLRVRWVRSTTGGAERKIGREIDREQKGEGKGVPV